MARQCYTCNSNAFIRSAWKSIAFAKSGRRSGFVFENERRNTPKTLLAPGFWLLALLRMRELIPTDPTVFWPHPANT